MHKVFMHTDNSCSRWFPGYSTAYIVSTVDGDNWRLAAAKISDGTTRKMPSVDVHSAVRMAQVLASEAQDAVDFRRSFGCSIVLAVCAISQSVRSVCSQTTMFLSAFRQCLSLGARMISFEES